MSSVSRRVATLAQFVLPTWSHRPPVLGVEVWKFVSLERGVHHGGRRCRLLCEHLTTRRSRNPQTVDSCSGSASGELALSIVAGSSRRLVQRDTPNFTAICHRMCLGDVIVVPHGLVERDG